MQYFCVAIPGAVRPTVLQQTYVGSLTCEYIWVGAVRMKGESATKKFAQELTWRDRKTARYPAPTRGSNPGSSDLNSDALTTELRPPVAVDDWSVAMELWMWMWGEGAELLQPHATSRATASALSARGGRSVKLWT